MGYRLLQIVNSLTAFFLKEARDAALCTFPGGLFQILGASKPELWVRQKFLTDL